MSFGVFDDPSAARTVIGNNRANPIDGADVSADGRRIIGNEDVITDFESARDAYRLSTN